MSLSSQKGYFSSVDHETSFQWCKQTAGSCVFIDVSDILYQNSVSV